MYKQKQIPIFVTTVLTVQKLLLTRVELLFSLQNTAKEISQPMSKGQVRPRVITVLGVSKDVFKTVIHLLTRMSLDENK